MWKPSLSSNCGFSAHSPPYRPHSPILRFTFGTKGMSIYTKTWTRVQGEDKCLRCVTEDRESCCRVSVPAASLQCCRRRSGEPYVQEGWAAPPWGRQGDDPFDQVSLEAFAFLHNLSICCMIHWNHKGSGLVRQSWLDGGRVRLGPFKIQAEESLSFSLCSGLGIAAVQPPHLGDHHGPGCVGTAAAWEPWAVWALPAYGCG